jgi:hypothetical protein
MAEQKRAAASDPIPSSFGRVKEILDRVIVAWRDRTHRDPRLNRHGPQFGWATKQELLTSEAFGRRLVQPEVIGNNQGHLANIVIALRKGLTPYPRMPFGGPYIPDGEISEIEDWINRGAPD